MGNEKRSTPVASAYPQQAGFLSQLSDGPKEFMKESIHLVNRCTKPDRRGKNAPNKLEFSKHFQNS